MIVLFQGQAFHKISRFYKCRIKGVSSFPNNGSNLLDFIVFMAVLFYKLVSEWINCFSCFIILMVYQTVYINSNKKVSLNWRILWHKTYLNDSYLRSKTIYWRPVCFIRPISQWNLLLVRESYNFIISETERKLLCNYMSRMEWHYTWLKESCCHFLLMLMYCCGNTLCEPSQLDHFASDFLWHDTIIINKIMVRYYLPKYFTPSSNSFRSSRNHPS